MALTDDTRELFNQLVIQTSELEKLNATMGGFVTAVSTGDFKKLADEMKKVGEATKKTTDLVDQHGKALKKANDLQGEGNKEKEKEIGLIQKLAIGTEQVTHNYQRLNRELLRSSQSFGREMGGLFPKMAKGGKAADIFSSAVSSGSSLMGSGVAQLVKSIAPASFVLASFANVLGGAVAIIGSLFLAGMKQRQELFESYQKLSRAGAGTAEGLDGVRRQIKSAGLALGEHEFFLKAVNEHAKDFAGFGSTLVEGLDFFSGVVGQLENASGDYRMQLEHLGYDMEKITDLTAKKMQLDMRTSKIAGRTTAEQVESVMRWTKELDRAARLTGASTDELMKAEMSRLADDRWRATMVAMRGTDEGKNLSMAIGMLEQVAPELAKGFMHAAGGSLHSDQAQMVVRSIPGMQGILDLMKTNPEAAMAKLAESITDESIDFFASLQRIIGQTPFGDPQEMLMLRNVFKHLTTSTMSVEEAFKAARKEQEAVLGTTNDTVGTQVRMNESIRDVMKGHEDLVGRFKGLESVVTLVTGAMTKLLEGMNALIDWLPKKGATPVGVTGDLDYEAMISGGGIAGSAPASASTGRPSAAGSTSSAASATPSSAPKPSASSGGTGGLGAGKSDAGSALSSADMSGLEFANKILDQNGIKDPRVRARLLGLAQLESSMRPSIKGPLIQRGLHKGHQARGLWQIMPLTARDLRMPIGTDEEAAQAGLAYFMQNYKRFGSLDLATVAHHAGPGGAIKYRDFGSAGTVDRATGLATDSYLSKVRTLESGFARKMGFKKGGVSRGPDSGYMQLLHGTEAVVPLPDGKSIPVAPAGPKSSYTGMGLPKVEIAQSSGSPLSVKIPEMYELSSKVGSQLEALTGLSTKLDELIYQLRKSNTTGEKILQATRL